MSMTMMLLTGVIVNRKSYRPVFAAAGILPILALAALFVLVRKVRPIALPEIYSERVN